MWLQTLQQSWVVNEYDEEMSVLLTKVKFLPNGQPLFIHPLTHTRTLEHTNISLKHTFRHIYQQIIAQTLSKSWLKDTQQFLYQNETETLQEFISLDCHKIASLNDTIQFNTNLFPTLAAYFIHSSRALALPPILAAGCWIFPLQHFVVSKFSPENSI